jgi:hypothetical protein
MKIYFYYEIKPCQPGARWLLSKLNTTSTNYSNCIKNFVAVGFFCATFDYSVLFKILILIYKILIHILNFFMNKSNHNKI